MTEENMREEDDFSFSLSDDLGHSLEEEGRFYLYILQKNPSIEKDSSLALVHNKTLAVNRSSKALITKSHLQSCDTENTGKSFHYLLKKTPIEGGLFLGKTSLCEGSSFTQDDIDRGCIFYLHTKADGQERDSFVFAVVDDQGSEIFSRSFDFRISTENASPVLSGSAEIEVGMASASIIPPSSLEVTDDEQGAQDLIYTLTRPPEHGDLLDIHQGFLTKGSCFSQENINRGELSYIHSGQGETDSFYFSVRDGAGGHTEESKLSIIISKRKENVNESSFSPDLLMDISQHKTLPVNRGEKNAITSDFFFLDPQHKQSYAIEQKPRFGFLTLEDEKLFNSSVFSDRDIVEGKLHYQNTDDSSERDSFSFFALDDEESPQEHKHEFQIQLIKNNQAPSLVENHLLFVSRGAQLTINRQTLQAIDQEQGPKDLVYTLLSNPQHGSLLHLEEGILEQSSHFTQEDINRGLIAYSHDSSDTRSDAFTFVVSDGAGGMTGNSRFSFRISESPLVLAKSGPLTLLEGNQVSFSSEQLEAHHIEGKKIKIVYTITKAPQKGYLSLNGELLRQGMSFSQEDIKQKKIIYQHSSS